MAQSPFPSPLWASHICLSLIVSSEFSNKKNMKPQRQFKLKPFPVLFQAEMLLESQKLVVEKL